MRRIARPLFTVVVILFFALPALPALASNVTVNGTVNFSALDGSADDADHVVNGIFTVNGDLTVNGTINCNDDGPGSNAACAMRFAVSGNVVMNAGSAMYAEDRRGTGNGGDITINAGGSMTLHGPASSLAGAVISGAALGSATGNGGTITINSGGASTFETGTVVNSASKGNAAGKVLLTSGGSMTVSGLIAAGATSTLLPTRQTGDILDGASGHQQGGEIRVQSTSVFEPSVLITSTATIASQGKTIGAGPVTIEGCGVIIRGLVASIANDDAPTRVVVRSGKGITVDATGLGISSTSTHLGQLRSDATSRGAASKRLDLFAADAIEIDGPDPSLSSLYAASSAPNPSNTGVAGGSIRAISLRGTVTGSGRVFLAGQNSDHNTGGSIDVSSQGTVTLDHGTVAAIGDFTKLMKDAAGGHITARSYSGNVSWVLGVGDVRPIGAGASGVAGQGTIALTACGTVAISGTSFPTNGPAVGVFPTITTGACSPAAPSLPIGEPALPICCNIITVTNPAVTSGAAGVAFSQTFTQTGAIGTSTFTLASGALPAGLSLSTSGVLSGTPAVVGSFPITVLVTDSQGCMGIGSTYNLQITCPNIIVTNPAVSSGVAAAPVSQTFTESGGVGTTTFSIASGTLPAGLSLAANGTLSGTPTQTGTFSITVTATDSNGCTGTGTTYTLTITCQTITVTNPAVSSGVAGTPFSQTFTQSGGIGTTTFSLASGTLPTGLSLAANGTLSGTPTQTGSFAITVKATDSNGCTGTGATYTMTIACQTITVTNPAVSSGTVNSPFSQTFTQSGGIGTTTFSLASGTLPAGLSLGSNGTLSGTPTQTGSFAITVKATDSNGCSGTGATYTLTIACQVITVINPGVSTGVAGSPFSQTFTSSNAVGTTTFTLASGTLPSGLSLAANGTLSGTPTVVGSFPITVTVTDANGCTGTGTTYNLTITCQTITVTAPVVNTGVAGSPFSQTFTQSGAIGTATFSLAAGSLPGGMSLATNGTLSGTPTQTGTFPITVKVTDSNGCTGSVNYTLTIACPVITVTNPSVSSGVAGAPFSQTFTQTGAVGSATFSTSSTLPAGLSLSAFGILSGTPTQTGSFPIVVTVTDANGCTGSGPTYNLTITCQTITVTNPSVNTGTAGTPFTASFTQSGAIGTATFTLASGSLPAGVTLAAGGTLSGVPMQVGSFPITVTVTDSNGCTGTSATYTLTIGCQTITVTHPATMSGTVGTPFSQQYTQSGGIGTVTFTTSSTLPAGMTLAADGTLSGTPTQSGTFPITVVATDSNGCTGSDSFTLMIGCQTITVTNPAVTTGTVGTPFSQVFTQSGGIGTTTFSLASGTLPTGLSLAANGTLSGTPTQSGTFAITVTATDANGCSGTGPTYTLVISCQIITVANPATSTGTVGAPFSQVFTQSGGIGTVTFTTSSTLPAGLSLAANGTLSGTPTQTGSFPIVVTATDSNGCTGTGATYTLVIACQTITVTNPATTTGTVDAGFSQTFTQSGAIGFANFTIASGTLPAGLSLSPSGLLSGTPQVPGTFPITVTATDANGCSGTGPTYTLVIACQTITVTNPASNTGTYNTALSGSFTFTQTGVGTHTPAVFSLNSGSLPAGVTLTSGGVLSGTPTQTGVFTITVKATDANGCSGVGPSYTLTIAPNLTAKSYTDVGNTQLDGGLVAPVTPTVVVVAVSNGDQSDAAITYAITAPPTHGTLTTFNSNGTFLYTPNAGNLTGDAFTYTGTSNGVSVSRTATIAFSGMVWYVDNATLSGTNDGRSNTPFKTMTAVGAASTSAGDFIYVSKGSGPTTGSYTMLASQKLIGAGATLNVFGILIVPGAPANTPTLSGTLTLASNVVVNGIDMSTGTSGAITGTNVTGINVTARNVTTTTGTAVSITGSASGGTMTFKSVSSNGGANGIVLQNFGGSGTGFTVTGAGSAGSGGAIANTVGADGGIPGNGVYLDTSSNISLAYMQINDHQNFGIFGNNVTNLTLDHVVVSGVNGTNAAGTGEGSVAFTGLQGSATVSNSNISGGLTDNFRVLNNAGQILNRLTVTATTFGPNSTASGNDGLTLQGTNGTLNVTVTGSSFTSARGDLFQLDLHGTVTSDLVFTGNTLSNNHPNIVSGGGGVTIGGGGVGDNPTLTYLIDSNTMRDSLGSALAIGKGTGTGNFSGTISNNTIGVTGVPNSGSSQGSGISVISVGGGTSTAHITGNQILQYNNNGIMLQVGAGSGSLNATVTRNTVTQPGTFATNGIFVNVGTATGDANQACISLGGAGALANSITGSSANGATDFRLRERFLTTVRLPGYGGANNNNAAVIAFVQGNNGGTPTGTVANNVPTGGGYVGGAPCP